MESSSKKVEVNLSEFVYAECKPEDISYVTGRSYSNLNTLIAIPTRGMINYRIVMGWKTLMQPLNSSLAQVFIEGYEVGEARNKAVEFMLANREIKYLCFLDDDVIIPEQAMILLYRQLTQCGYDVIGGMYHKKDQLREPLGYYNDGHMTPITRDQELSKEVIPIDVVGMGCTIIKREVLEKISFPWFKTDQHRDGNKTSNITEDVYFCRKAKELGFKIGIHTGISCGHLDTSTGVIY